LLQEVEFKYDVLGNRIEKKHDSNGDGGFETTQPYDGWKNVNQGLVGNENFDVWADLDGSSSLPISSDFFASRADFRRPR
jgi:hypothetical protein